MNNLIYILFSFLMTMTMSCGSNSTQSKKSTEDSLADDSTQKVEMAIEAQRQDSIAKAHQDSIVKAREDSVAKARQDSIARRTRVTPDMAFLNVHGPVKTVKDEDGKMWEFTSDGKLKSVPSGYTRNSKGYIVQKKTPYEMCTYEYNGSMQLVKMSYEDTESGEGSLKGNFSYNKQGLISSFTAKEMYEEEVLVKTIQYNYTNVDKYGNWTARTWTQNIKIQNPYLNNKIMSSETTKGSHHRTITYYE